MRHSMTRPTDSQLKKRTCWIVDFGILVHYRVKIQESEKRDKYVDLTKELKKYYRTWEWQWNQL